MIFRHLKDYAQFLLDHHLDELTTLNLSRAREVKLPLLKLFSHMSEAQVFEYSRNSLKELLTQLAAGTAMDHQVAGLRRWKADQIQEVPKTGISGQDLMLSPHTRKFAMIRLLRQYTSDLDIFEAVVQELEYFYASVLADTVEAFVEIQQEKLHAEKELFRAVIDNTDDGITVFDTQFGVTLWNRSLAEQSGVRAEEIVGKNFFAVFPACRDTPDGEAMAEALKGKKISLTDRPYLLRDGYYESDVIPLRNPAGEVTGLLAVSRDISERKKAIEKLTRSEALMARAQEVAHFGSWEWNLSTGELNWSDEMYRIYGYEPQGRKLTAEWIFSHYVPEDRENIFRILEEIKKQPQPFTSVHRIFRKDGAGRFIQVLGSVETDARGQVVKLYGASQDITELRQAEEQLRRHQYFIERIADTTPNLLYIYDVKQGQNIYTNRELFRQLGYTYGQAREKGAAFLEDVIHPDDWPRVKRTFRKLSQASDNDVTEVTYRIRTASGDWLWFYDRATVFSRDPDGSVRETLGTSQDITLQKASQQELQHKNFELNQALEEYRAAQESLMELNNLLEQKVEERTRELAASELSLRKALVRTIDLNNQLQSRENFLASIIDQTPVSTWIADAEGTMIQVNKACLGLFGVENEALGLGRYNILKDNTLQDKPFYSEIKAVFSEGKIFRAELEYDLSGVRHVDIPTGRHITLITTVFPIRNADGKVINAVVQHEDITARKKVEQALLYQSRLTKIITDNATSALFMMDARGYCTFMNPAGEKMLGFTFEEISQQPLHYMIHHHHPDGSPYPLEDCPIDRALPQNSEIRAHQDVFIRKDGTFFPVSCAASPIFENGVPVATVVEVHDLTAEKESQAQLLQVNNQLGAKNTELLRINTDLDNFIYAASHDLRAPIANLEAILTRLNKRLAGRLEAAEVPLLEFASTAIGRLKQTITDLTEISRAQRDTGEQAGEVFFEEILTDIKLDISSLIAESGANIRTQLEVPSLHYARKNLRSILYNLVSNAIKYRSPDRPLLITVTTRREGSDVVLTVGDNGLGIPASQLPRMFVMFRRFHSHVEGSGIGLSIVKRIVENSGGSISVASEESRGTSFTITFREQNP